MSFGLFFTSVNIQQKYFSSLCFFGFSSKLYIFFYFSRFLLVFFVTIAVVINNRMFILVSMVFFQKELMKPYRNQTDTSFAEGCKGDICTVKYRSVFKGWGSYNLCHDHTWLLMLCCTYYVIVHLLWYQST